MVKAATALAHPNIAFIKYWGNRNHELRLPANSSLSMNLGGLQTKTTVEFDQGLATDELTLNRQSGLLEERERVSAFLAVVRQVADIKRFGRVESENNFPSGSGIASSSSAFAALALAASRAAGIELNGASLSRLARRGSGSASRSVPGGFVEWRAAGSDEESYAVSIAPADHWALEDCIAIVNEEHKEIGSSQGHQLADTSALQAARVAGADERLNVCRQAILERDFAALAKVSELDNHLMHAVMMTSQPPLLYWQSASIAVMHAVTNWRAAGAQAFYTLDAGPNVHVICEATSANDVAEQLAKLPGVQRVLRSGPGGPAHLLD